MRTIIRVHRIASTTAIRLGLVSIAAAQLLFAVPALAQAAAKTPAPPKTLQTRVWVNSSTKVYHCPGSEYYGKTQNGEFMEEAQARGYGNRAVGGRACANSTKKGRAPLPDTTAASKKLVWLNTESGVYHCPGASDYGMTQRGKYMTESDATTSGKKPAAGKKCAAP